MAGKLALRLVLLVVAVVLVAGAGAAGLLALRDSLRVSDHSHTALRHAYEVGHRAGLARRAASQLPPDTAEYERQRRLALAACAAMIDAAPTGSALLPDMLRLRAALDEPGSAGDAPLALVASLAGDLSTAIVRTQRAAGRRLSASLVALASISAIVIAGAVVLGVRQHRAIMRPVRALAETACAMRDGDLARRVPQSGDREMADLAGAFNDMADRLEAVHASIRAEVEAKAARLLRSEQLAAVGQIAAGVAHEINNPLAVVIGYAESARARLGGPQPDTANVRDDLGIIIEESLRCRDITESLLTMARPARQTAPADAGRAAERVARVLSGLERHAGRTIALSIDDRADLRVGAGDDALTQILTNLVANALEATDEGAGRVAIEVSRRDAWVRIAVRDNGRGLAPDQLARVFEPFYSDKPEREPRGVGLGLTVAHTLAERHAGRLEAHSDGRGRGAVFTLELPFVGAVAQEASRV